MSGFAAEFRGVRLWTNVAIAMFVCVLGIWPNTWRRSKMMYGDQHMMNTTTITIVILTVLTFARGIMPRELARLLARSSLLVLPPRRSTNKIEREKRWQWSYKAIKTPTSFWSGLSQQPLGNEKNSRTVCWDEYPYLDDDDPLGRRCSVTINQVIQLVVKNGLCTLRIIFLWAGMFLKAKWQSCATFTMPHTQTGTAPQP